MMYLILGGQKSGKSGFALQQLLRGAGPQCLLVTGKPADQAFRRQVQAHRQARPARLPVTECGTSLFESIHSCLEQGHMDLLVDSLDFWLFASMQEGRSVFIDLEQRLDELEAQLAGRGATLGFVSSEVSLGPVAADAFTRSYVRELGTLHQILAARCAAAWLLVAGIPLELKKGGAWHTSES